MQAVSEDHAENMAAMTLAKPPEPLIIVPPHSFLGHNMLYSKGKYSFLSDDLRMGDGTLVKTLIYK